eukprot:GFUD01057732.1.p1 GENE.GFUD01057732.1~~GFUD01057732.1.p1  ORF type:complete len:198 (+),score=59.43 GFUD01057732.1:211-804(+)
MSDSKPGSEHNLNDSNMPLLSEDGTEKAEKGGETFENELEEKKDESTEKKKKDKKLKVPKEKPGYDHDNLDMTLRDSKGINRDIDLDFDDILAEPSTAHGFDPIWRLSFVLFTQIRRWIYRIIAAFIAVPLSIIWAIIFSILSVILVWVVRPLIRIVQLFLAVFKELWVSFLQATLDPLCATAGALFGRVKVSNNSV